MILSERLTAMRSVYAYTSHTYTLTYVTESGKVFTFDHVTRSWVADRLKIVKAMIEEGYVTGYTLNHKATHVEPYETDICYGCKARPSLWDMDCDGPYATAQCGECDWWACVNARELVWCKAMLTAWRNGACDYVSDTISYVCARYVWLTEGHQPANDNFRAPSVVWEVANRF
jgi:hypothetical protein